MIVMIMGAPGVCKGLLRKYLVHEKGFKDFTPTIDINNSFDSFFDSVASYVNASQAEGDIVLSRTFFEHKEIYIPAHFKAGMIYLSNDHINHLNMIYKKFLSFAAPNGVIYLKTDYMNASNRMQMNGNFVSQQCYDDYLLRYQDMFNKLASVPFQEINVEEESKDLYEDVDFILNSFKRESKSGTIWSKQIFYDDFE